MKAHNALLALALAFLMAPAAALGHLEKGENPDADYKKYIVDRVEIPRKPNGFSDLAPVASGNAKVLLGRAKFLAGLAEAKTLTKEAAETYQEGAEAVADAAGAVRVKHPYAVAFFKAIEVAAAGAAAFVESEKERYDREAAERLACSKKAWEAAMKWWVIWWKTAHEDEKAFKDALGRPPGVDTPFPWTR